MKNWEIKNGRATAPYKLGNSADALILRDEEGGERDIVARAFQFAVEILRFCHKLDERPGVSRVVMSQILRAGTSVGANLEEAQAGQSRADFLSKVSIALKEARETHFRLRVLNESQVFSLPELPELTQEAYELRQILGAIVASTKSARKY